MPGRIGHHLNEFLPNLIIGQIGWKSIEMMPGRIGQIGWKSIEITLYACVRVRVNVISMDLHPFDHPI